MRTREETVACLCGLGRGAPVAFCEHVRELERLPDDGRHMERTRFKSLPFWMVSYWLPVDFSPPLTRREDDDMALIGSCQQLLRELEEIRRLSPLGLGTKPRGYDLARTDFKRWDAENHEYGTDEVIQWIWGALHEGAELAIRHKTVLEGNSM